MYFGFVYLIFQLYIFFYFLVTYFTFYHVFCWEIIFIYLLFCDTLYRLDIRLVEGPFLLLW